MQKRTAQTFNVMEFEDAMEAATDVVAERVWNMQEIHSLIISTMEDRTLLHGEPVPEEWKTGFVFGVVCEIVLEAVSRNLPEHYQADVQLHWNNHAIFHRALHSKSDGQMSQHLSRH